MARRNPLTEPQPFQRLMEREWRRDHQRPVRGTGRFITKSLPGTWEPFKGFKLRGRKGATILVLRASSGSQSTPAQDNLDPTAYTHFEVRVEFAPGADPDVAGMAHKFWGRRYKNYDRVDEQDRPIARAYAQVAVGDIQRLFNWFMKEMGYVST